MLSLVDFRRKLDPLVAEYKHSVRVAKEERLALIKARQRIEVVTESQKIVQDIAEQVQAQAHRQIASVVTRCLEAIFKEEAYSFEIRFEQKRGKTDAVLVFTKDGLELTDPLNEAGGGCVDIASFALRLVCLVLSLPRKRKLLVVDEPFRFVSTEYRPAVRELLEKIASEMQVQIVMVTHISEIATGKVIEIGEE